MRPLFTFLTLLSFAVPGAFSGCANPGAPAGVTAPPAGGVLVPGGAGPTDAGGGVGAGSAGSSAGASGGSSGGGPGGAAAAAGGADSPIPPRADAGDCMTIGLDGSVYCGAERREACRVFYVPLAKMKVFPGTGADLPPIPLTGKTALNGRFYAEVGSAPLSCEEDACWTWESIPFGDAVRMRLTRRQPSSPALQFYQDAAAEMEGPDGANLSFSFPVEDEDEIEFYGTFVEEPFGMSSTLVPLTESVWEKWGAKCEMGGFAIDTGVSYRKAKDASVPDPFGGTYPFLPR